VTAPSRKMGKILDKARIESFLKNVPLVFIALALAVLVWYSIGREITDRVELELPFRVTLESQAGLEILGTREWQIKVALRGPRSEIQRIRSTSWNIRGTYAIAAVDLPPDRDEIVQHVPVDAKSFSLPASNLFFTGFHPDEVEVQIGRTGEKRLRVVPAVSGKPAEGYAVASPPRAVPRTVLVKGPLLALRTLEEVRTRPVDIDERNSTVVERTRLLTRAATRSGTFDLVCEEEDVDVIVSIQEVPAEVVVARVPIRVEIPQSFPADRFFVRLKEEARDVTVRGPKPLLRALEASNVRLLASVKPEVNEEWFEKSDAVDRDAALAGWVVGLPREDAARLEVVLGRAETTYVLTRIKK